MEERLKREVEALLFAAGRKLTMQELIHHCKSDRKEVEEALLELKEEYASRDSSLFLIDEADGWKMTIRDKYIGLVRDVAPHTELNKSMLETLAVIAWKTPALQSEVVKMRTSKAYEDIALLLDMGFISKEKKGRSFVLKPTGRFFDYFDLPGKEKLHEMFKQIQAAQQGETQQQIGDAAKESQKLGELEVFKVPKEHLKDESKESLAGKDVENFGKLEVFSVPEEDGEESDEGAGEEQDEDLPAEDLGENAKDNAENLVKRLGLDEEEKTDQEEAEEPDDEDEPSSRKARNMLEEMQQPKKEVAKERRKMPKELEDFAAPEDKLGQ
ncbi:MAG TPA: SMC-Scp complex subunit ScpB [Candidatus Nanoarchaeia archaeon]|nr:SMC-Scp complex subunit ScpB [Candidatus Nanoarchaeia archaeon]